MKLRIILFVLMNVFAVTVLSSCADDDDNNTPNIISTDPNNPDPDPDNRPDERGLWDRIELVRNSDMLDPNCARTGPDIIIINRNGDFHLKKCDGVRDSVLTNSDRVYTRRLMNELLESDLSRRECAEIAPLAETTLRATFASGQSAPLFEELIRDGRCTYGDSEDSLRLYRWTINLLEKYQINQPAQ